MASSTLELTTPAGVSRTPIFTPDGAGPWPAVILAFDAGGQRPAMAKIAERIAKDGYLVAVPDLFHRVGPIEDILPPGVPVSMEAMRTIFADQALRTRFFTTYYAQAIDYDNLRTDVGALLDVLAERPDVTGKIGSTGYCMGGNVSLRLATLFGDRIAASASFHGGGLATPAPDSPHLRAGSIKAQVYVAGAIEDDSFTDAAKQQLTEALEAAKVRHTVETYPARHGFVVSDNPSYDEGCSERHHMTLRTFFAEALRA